MRTLIFLNGRIPRSKVINYYKKRNCRIIAADGGANSLVKSGIMPGIIIGDLDSITRKTFDHYKKKKVKILHINDQDTTDLEKCLKYCIGKKAEEIIIFGATSMRPDHTLNNFSIIKRYYKKSDLKIVTEEFEIFYLKNKFNFNYKPNQIISLLAIPVAKNITTTGLEYPLSNETLEFGVREGTLNKSVSDKISISFKSGHLILFRKHFI